MVTFSVNMVSSMLVAVLFLPINGVVANSRHVVVDRERTQVQQEPEYIVPSFGIEALRRGLVRSDHQELRRALGSTGLIAIEFPDSSNFELDRETTFSGLCDCLLDANDVSNPINVEGADTSMLRDGLTLRRSIATATLGTTPLPLPIEAIGKACPNQDLGQGMENLRDHVAAASQAFMEALDRDVLPFLSQTSQRPQKAPSAVEGLLRNSYGGVYHSVSDIVGAASNLEHFHVYSKERKDVSTENADKRSKYSASLATHTDAGLFLAFAPGYDCDTSAEVDRSFHVRDMDGVTKRAVFPPGSVAIMLGVGAEHWLRNVDGLKATHHSVQMEEGQARAWYGMMHLVPESAIIQESPQRTFGDMRKGMTVSNTEARTFGSKDNEYVNYNEDVSVGCGNSPGVDIDNNSMVSTSRRRLQHVSSASVCNNSTNFYCWLSCIDIPQADLAQGFINEGYSLYCLDPSILVATGNKVSRAMEPCTNSETGVVGGIMNTACMGSWQPTAPGVQAQVVDIHGKVGGIHDEMEKEPFCFGGTSMYMDGFNWVGTSCIVYLFPSWVIDSKGKLAMSCVATMLFGIVLEWIIRKRRTTVTPLSPGTTRLLVSAAFYFLQLSLGYALMLVVMIYSIPLFLSVVVGLVGGHILFNAKDAIFVDSGKGQRPSSYCAGAGTGSASKEQGEDGGAQNNNSKSTKKEMVTVTTNDSHFSFRSYSDVEDVAEGSTPCCQHTL